MARVLVTGATGHLGAHLVRDLLAQPAFAERVKAQLPADPAWPGPPA